VAAFEKENFAFSKKVCYNKGNEEKEV